MTGTRKPFFLYAAIILLTALIYNALLFMFKDMFDTAQRVGYAFTMLAFALLILDPMTIKGKLTVFPMFGVSATLYTWLYAAIQFLFGGVILQFIPSFNIKAIWATEIILLALYAGATLAIMMGTQIVRGQDTLVKRKTLFISNALQELDSSVALVKEDDARNAIETLGEDVRCSDPMSHDSLASMEGDIIAGIIRLRQTAGNRGNAVIAEEVKALRELVKERNCKCRMNK